MAELSDKDRAILADFKDSITAIQNFPDPDSTRFG